MTKHFSKHALIGAMMAIGGGGAVAIATEINSETSNETIPAPSPIACSIETHIEQGAFVIEAKVASLTPTEGNFSFQISGGANGNSSQIRQGGTFETNADSPTIVGRVRLGANNALYKLDLDINSPLGDDNCDVQLGL